MRKKAVELAKGQDEEKVGISLKIPKNLKDRLQLFSEQEDVSMNALITSCIELMLDDSCGNLLKQIDNLLVQEIGQLSHKISNFELIDEGDDKRLEKMKATYDLYMNLFHQVRRFI
ncbi:MAG: hypothetical protein WC667_06890 [Sulfurimonas sp.]|jgi:hypothetical protein